METHRCTGRLWNDYDMRGYQCSKSGKYEEEGKWWCGTHAPSKVKARHEKQAAKYDAESKEREANRLKVRNRIKAEAMREAAKAIEKLHDGLSNADMALGARAAFLIAKSMADELENPQ